jgi:thiamine biosynthesis protein ThiC
MAEESRREDEKEKIIRVVKVKVCGIPLKEAIWLVGSKISSKYVEKGDFWKILEDIRNGVTSPELEAKYGKSVYNTLKKMLNSGMIERVGGGRYRLSLRFSEILRKFAEEWEKFVRGGE